LITPLISCFSMETTSFKGKKEGSELFLVNEISEIYVKNRSRGNSIYVKCYHGKCSATGTLKDFMFYNSKSNHHDHETPSMELFYYFEFYNSIKLQASETGQPLHDIYDNAILRYKHKVNFCCCVSVLTELFLY